MKYLFTLFFLFQCCLFGFSQTTVNYTESTSDFPNPERGFYRHTSTHSDNYTALNSATLATYRNLHSPSSAGYSVYSTLILRVFYLDDFTSTDISSTYLTNLQADFDAIRTAGLKAVIRFAYTNNVDGSGCANWICPPYGDASKTQIETHINQLKPYITANSDVIAAIQMGFIGTWGEQYYTDYFGDASVQNYWTDTNWQDRIDVLNYMLTHFPTERMIQVRMPQIKQKAVYGIAALTSAAAITQAQAHQGTTISRIGFHNDCFLASYTDFGTYNDYGSGPPTVYAQADTTNLKSYKSSDSKYVVVGGETCSAYAPFDNCDNDGGIAETELQRFHYSYLNADYNNTVNDGWIGKCMDDIKKKLGYRLVLENGTYSDEAQANQVINVAINLKNVGYAAPFNQRGLELILRNTSDGSKYYATLTDDARFWITGSHSISHTLCIPSTMPNGTYDLLLNLPDPKTSLYANPDYAIQLANTSIWESSTGYNDLGHSITINNTASATACNGEVTFQFSSSYLPVELMDFGAKCQADGVELNWQTASEINNYGFSIEVGSPSQHRIEWTEIGFEAGNGTTTDFSNYSFYDKSIRNGTVYYRLKQIDKDGGFEYSDVISVECSSINNRTKIFPNPTNDELTIRTDWGKRYEIYDIHGRLLKSDVLHQETSIIELEGFSNGLYFLTIYSIDHQSETLKFIIEK